MPAFWTHPATPATTCRRSAPPRLPGGPRPRCPDHAKAGPRLRGGPAFEQVSRRRPTLPGSFPPSTIGAERLNDSVRNGKRCVPLAIATGKERGRPGGTYPQNYIAVVERSNSNERRNQDLGSLVLVCCTHCC